jgi:LuxR family maltose regulon positive regulatory protein
LAEQAIQLGTQPGELVHPEVGWPFAWQAMVLCEWNQLDTALSLAEKAISLSKQTASIGSPMYLLVGYSILLHIYLSRGELDAARSAFQQFERIGMSMNQHSFILFSSYWTTVDQVRLWLACGELDHAARWADNPMLEKLPFPFVCERKEVACIRVLLATNQPKLALERLEPILVGVVAGKRWGHVIEIRLLQALAYQMLQEETLALKTLSEAIRLAEPGGYIRSFVDESSPIETLLYRLRKRDRKYGPTPYLDTLLTAFQQENRAHAQVEEPIQAQALHEPLSERELQVLRLLAQGLSNQEIAQELIIAYNTVKRHVSHIFGRLGVNNRVQATKQARELGLLDQEI